MRRMTADEIVTISGELGFPIGAEEAPRIKDLTDGMFDTIDRFDAVVADSAAAASEAPHAERDAGRPPTADEDPLGAVLRLVDVSEPGVTGLLTGLSMLMKDNIPIAGVPMTMGSAVLTDYVPEEDAELTARVLAAGGRIVAVTNMEAFAFSGGGETSAHRRTENPFDRARTASGSSTGSAVGLWYDGIDLAWGTDTGGSCRIPASWSGVLGLKPTHGLVPVTGIPTSDWRFDHAGPLARTVEMMALGLDAVVDEVVWDDADLRAPVRIDRGSYRAAVAGAPSDLSGVRIGVVSDGFAPAADPDAPAGTVETAEAVHEALRRFEQLGAELVEIDLPVLSEGGDVMFAAMLESATAATLGWPTAYHWFSESAPDFAQAMRNAIVERGDAFPVNFKAVLLMGSYLNRVRGGSVGALAHRLAPAMRAAVDDALTRVDVLMMPTTTHTPFVAGEGLDPVALAQRGWGMMNNVPLFNLTGHPALSMPAATALGLPVGVMAVAPRHADARLLEIARSYERAYGWQPAEPVFDWEQPGTFSSGTSASGTKESSL